MLDYLPVFPELMEALEEFDDAQVGRLLRAAAVYAFSGEEPDFAPGSPERFAWRFIRQRVDAAAAKREKKAAAGAQGGRPKKADESTEKQTKADESTEKQGEAGESLQEQSQEQAQAQGDPSPVNPVERAHTQGTQQADSAGARAGAGETVPAGWYDPEHPDRPCDASWLGSPQARKSIAQRILDHVIRRRVITPGAITAESGRAIGREIMEALQAAMAAGKAPAECQRMAQDARALWVWEIRLKEAALEYGTAPPGMAAAWREDVAELSAEAEDVALYG